MVLSPTDSGETCSPQDTIPIPAAIGVLLSLWHLLAAPLPNVQSTTQSPNYQHSSPAAA